MIEMNSASPTVPFPLLADPSAYQPCLWDLRVRDERRGYWLGLFRRHFPTLLDAYRREAEDRGEAVEVIESSARRALAEFDGYLDGLDSAEPGPDEPPLNILTICTRREQILRGAGIADPYRLAKRRDTEHALALLPSLLAELDAMPEADRRMAIMEGVFAGNIYDLGATETVAMFTDHQVDFRAVRRRLNPRPWRFDDLDRWLERLDDTGAGPHRAAALFVDNAGPDVTLGMIPLARWLLGRGTRVILTANATPSLNDVTHDELRDLIAQVAAFDPPLREALDDGRLSLVASGNHAPLIDLGAVSPDLAEAVVEAGVDLVILEGMGRAVESNFDAELTCDTLKLAMIKDRGVAEGLCELQPGTEVFDLVMRFAPAARQ